MSTGAVRPGVPALRIATGVVVAAALWTAVNLLVLSNVLDPLPDGTGWVSLTIFLAGAIAAGMAMGTGWAGLLAVVPPVVAHSVGFYADLSEPLPVVEWGIPLWAVLLTAGGLAGARCPMRTRRAVVVAVALVAGLLALAAGLRTLWPHDAAPPVTVAVLDIAAGRAGTVSLGDALDAAAARLEAPRYRQTAGQPFREPVPGVDLPGQVDLSTPYGVARGRGITLIGRRGQVTTILLTTWDAQTTTGIGVGDGLALVRDRHPGARCKRDRELDRPECVVTSGRRLAVFAGDPIAVIALTAPAVREAPPLTPAGGAAAP